eukprot:7259878-Pyramimonas_sp.AAC.1
MFLLKKTLKSKPAAPWLHISTPARSASVASAGGAGSVGHQSSVRAPGALEPSGCDKGGRLSSTQKGGAFRGAGGAGSAPGRGGRLTVRLTVCLTDLLTDAGAGGGRAV